MKIFINLLFSIIIPYSIFAQGDSPCTAVSLAVNNGICGVYTSGTTVGASYSNTPANGGTPTCASPGAPDVWYSFVAPASGVVTVTTSAGTITDSGIQLYSSSNNLCSGTLTALNCDDDNGPGFMSELSLCGFTAGNTYWVRVWRYGGAGTGTFNICIYAPPTPPVNTQNCAGATQICSSAPFSGNSNGFSTQELNVCNQGCLSVEHQSSWYIFQAQTTGTLQMTIAPAPGVDYDFAVWGPNPSCPPAGPPIRCSYDAGTGNTGINSTNNAPQTDNSEGALGNSWVQDMNVIAGQTYILLIDNFTANATPFNLNWGGSASLNCTPLPIQLISFAGDNTISGNVLSWETASELNNDYFTIERTQDAVSWIEIARIPGAGNSTLLLDYKTVDHDFAAGVNYYRLKQTDYNGQYVYSKIIVIDNSFEQKNIIRITNLLGQDVDESYEGARLIYFNDGSVIKRIGK